MYDSAVYNDTLRPTTELDGGLGGGVNVGIARLKDGLWSKKTKRPVLTAANNGLELGEELFELNAPTRIRYRQISTVVSTRRAPTLADLDRMRSTYKLVYGARLNEGVRVSKVFDASHLRAKKDRALLSALVSVRTWSGFIVIVSFLAFIYFELSDVFLLDIAAAVIALAFGGVWVRTRNLEHVFQLSGSEKRPSAVLD